MRGRMLLLAILAAVLVPALAVAGSRQDGELKAALSGKTEVPAGHPTGTGTAEVTLEAARVCWEIRTRGIGKAAAAHIHKAAPGKAGPVVVPFGAAYKAKGCTAAPAAAIRAIRARPAAYYVNVHTAKFPAGAVRGQLSAS